MSALLTKSLLVMTFTILVACAIYDVRKRIIPNELSALIAVAGIALTLLIRPEAIWTSLLIATTLLVALWVLFMRGVIGGGDAKLIAAATLLVPPDGVAALVLMIVLAGGVLSAAYMMAFAVLRSPTPVLAVRSNNSFRRFLRNERARIVAARSVPYGLAIAAGAMIALANEAVR